METPNPKCSYCYCYWTPNETDIKSSGYYYKTCKKCRVKNIENKEKRREYYVENKARINEYQKEKIICDCGCKVCKSHLERHIMTDKHKNKMQRKEKEIEEKTKALLKEQVYQRKIQEWKNRNQSNEIFEEFFLILK